jgi:predicted  nucleic acid-binding Zn-ribbon protein
MSDLSTEPDSGYRRGGAKRRPAKRGGRSGSGGAGNGSAKVLGTNVIMVLLLAGLAVAGWFIANQQRLLADGESRLNDANERLEVLESRLVATDDAMALEGQDTKQKLGYWEDEIRKLWAVSNDRNKKWIKDNERALDKISKTINGIEASTRDMRSSVSKHESAFAQQRSLIDQLTSLEQQMQQIVRGQRDLVDKVNTANQGVASVRASIQGKVDDNAEAIQAIDAYRVAVNSRLADIDRRLNLVSSPPG